MMHTRRLHNPSARDRRVYEVTAMSAKSIDTEIVPGTRELNVVTVVELME